MNRWNFKTFTGVVTATLLLTSAMPLTAAIGLPDRVPVPDDGDADGIPDVLADAISSEVCGRSTLRGHLGTASEASGGALGRCEGSDASGWTWFPPAPMTLAEITVPDPSQDPSTSAEAVDADGDGVPGSYAVIVKTLTIEVDSTGKFTYSPGEDVVVPAGDGPDPNDDPADPCSRSTPIPQVTPVSNVVPFIGPGRVEYELGADIVYDCADHGDVQSGTAGPVFPQTVARVLTGEFEVIDNDNDGVPSAFIFHTADRTFVDSSGDYDDVPAEPFMVNGPDTNDDPANCGANTPIPSVTEPRDSIVLTPQGSLVYELGVTVTIGCEEVASPVADSTPAALPITISGVPTGAITREDFDNDEIPGRYIIHTQDMTITAYDAPPVIVAGEDIIVPGPDPDNCDCDASLAGWVFVRNSDGDADTDWAELTGADPSTNPTWFLAVNDDTRTLSDTDGDGFTSQQEIAAGTNPDDPYSHPNRPPVLTLSIVNPSVDENVQLVITASATDPDPRFTNKNDPVKTELERLQGPPRDVPTVSCVAPTGAVAPTGTGSTTITWTPDYTKGRPAVYDFWCTATDHGMQFGGNQGSPRTHTKSGTIQVVDVNDRPTVDITLANLQLNEATTSEVPITFSDSGPNAAAPEDLTVTLVNPPSWVTLSPDRTKLVVSPTHDTVAHPVVGNFDRTITVQVSDGVTPAVTDTIAIRVIDVNRAPTGELDPALPGDGSYDVNENSAMTPVTLSVTDADGDPIACTAPVKHANMLLTGCTLTWTPAFSDSGIHAVELRAGDGIAPPIIKNFNVDVSNTNRVPTITKPGSAFTTVAEAETASFTLTADDPDGPAPTLSVTSVLPAWATFNAATGVFSVSPGYDVIGPFPATSASFDVTFQADDGEAQATVSHTFSVTNVNRQPTISATPVATIAENAPFAVTFAVNDPDGDALTFTLPTAPSAATFDANDRSVAWTPSYDYVPHSDPDLRAPANFIARIADGHGLFAEFPFTLDVTDVNRAPVFTAIGAQTVNEGGSLGFTPAATDPDGDAVTIVKSAGVGTFAAGVFSFAPDHTEVIHPATTATRSVTFTADDGSFGESVNMPVSITVNDVNRPPTAVLNGVFNAAMIVGDTTGPYSARVSVDCAGSADPDAEDVVSCEFAWGDGTPSDITSPATHDYTTAGPRTFTLKVTDGEGGVATATRTFRVYVGTADDDVDGLENREELTGSRNTLFGFRSTNPLAADTDNDMDKDGDEIIGGSDPNNKRSTRADRDGDGIPNGQESLLFSRTGLNYFNPDRGDTLPVIGSAPLHNGDVLIRPIFDDAESRARIVIYYDHNANGQRDPGELVVADTDLFYVLDPAEQRVTLKTGMTPLGGDTILDVEAADGAILVTTPDGVEHNLPSEVVNYAVVEWCATTPANQAVVVTETPTGYNVCSSAVKVLGVTVVAGRNTPITLPFPYSGLPPVPAGNPVFTPADPTTGSRAHVTIPMQSVVINRPPAEPTYGPATPVDMDVGPSVLVSPCADVFTPSPGQSELGEFCVGADVFVDGVQRAAKQVIPVNGLPFPTVLPAPVVSGEPQITQPDFAAGTAAKVVIPMSVVTLNKPPMAPTYDDAGADDIIVTAPAIKIVECAAPFTPAPAADEDSLGTACVGADVFVDGAPTPITRTTMALDGLPFPHELGHDTPAIDSPDDVVVEPANVATGTPTKITVKMERVTLHKPPTEPSRAPASNQVVVLGPAIQVAACADPTTPVTPRALPDEGVDYCVGANILVDGAIVVPGRQSGTLDQFPATLPETIAFTEPNPIYVQRQPNLVTGESGQVAVKMTQYTVHRADAEPPVTHGAVRTEVIDLPSLKVDACPGGASVRPDPDGDGVLYCAGAVVTVNGQEIDAREEGEINEIFPQSLGPVADVSKGAAMVVFTPPDTATGATASVSIERCILVVEGPEEDPAYTCTPTTPTTTQIGRPVKIDACAVPGVVRDPATGDVSYCFGADVYVDDLGTPKAEKVEGSVPGGFPHTLPADTPAANEPDFVDIDVADTSTGAPARVTIKMERVRVNGDGSTTRTPADPLVQSGPAIKIVPCPGAPVVRHPVTGDVSYCLGADVYVEDMANPKATQVEGSLPGGFPYTLPEDTPATSGAEIVTVDTADVSTGAPLRATIKMQRVTIHADGSTTAEPAPPRVVEGPKVKVVPCAATLSTDPGTGDTIVCVGADVYVDDMTTPVVTQQTTAIPAVPSQELPVDTPKVSDPDFLDVDPADLATGTPARVTIKMERVTVHGDGHTSAVDAAPQTVTGPAVKVVPCVGEPVTRHPTTGDVTYCFGADVFVTDMDTPVVTKQAGTVPGGFPYTLPAATPKVSDPSFLDVTPADPATGTGARVTIKMERVTIAADGGMSSAPEPSVVALGPGVKLELLDAANVPTTDPRDVKKVIVTVAVDADGNGSYGPGETTPYTVDLPTTYREQDADGDFIPDVLEPHICGLENPGNSADGSCAGGNYSLPTL